MGYSQRRRLEERLAREVGLALALLAVALAQVTLPPRDAALVPNALLLLVVCRALIAGGGSAARWAFYGGLGLDMCAGTLLGTHALALLAAAAVTLGSLARLRSGNWLMPLIGAALGALAYHAVLALITSLTVAPVDLRAYALVALLPDTLAALIPALPLFLLMRWITGRMRGEVPVDVY